MRHFLITIIVLTTFSVRAQSVKVAAAANLRFVFDEIRATYTRENPQADVSVAFGSTGTLMQQILNGAEFDLFMAADNTSPEQLKKQGRTAGEMKVYARGSLVLWSNTLDVSQGLSALTRPQVKRIAVAKPELAPYGDRTVAYLKKAGLYNQLKDKIIYADNISQTAQFAQTGNAEAGFLALSLTLTPEMKGSVYSIDPKLYQPIDQAMVLLKNRKPNSEAVKFMSFVLSKHCKPIFEKYGYIVP